MLSVKITFVLKAINLQTVRHRELPDCYDFTVVVSLMMMMMIGHIRALRCWRDKNPLCLCSLAVGFDFDFSPFS